MKKNYLAHAVSDMRKACQSIINFTDGLNKDDFMNNDEKVSAVMMKIIVIGEAANNIHKDYPKFEEYHSNIEWRQVRGMRDIMAHRYFNVDMDILWDVAKIDAPSLLSNLPDFLDDNDLDIDNDYHH